MAWACSQATREPFMPALSQLLPDKLNSASMPLADPWGSHSYSPGRSHPGASARQGQAHFSLNVHPHVGSCMRQTWHIITTGSENSCHSWDFAMNITQLLTDGQYQAPVPLKSPSEGKFCCAILANGHMESIFNSKSPHFRVVAFSSISFHHSKELIKNLLLQQGRLVQFGFYLLKNNHLSATEKEEKNLSLKIWRSASL